MSTIQRECVCVVGVEVERGAQELFMDSAVCISSGIGGSFIFTKVYLSCCAGFYLLHTGSSSQTRTEPNPLHWEVVLRPLTTRKSWKVF